MRKVTICIINVLELHKFEPFFGVMLTDQTLRVKPPDAILRGTYLIYCKFVHLSVRLFLFSRFFFFFFFC